MISIWIAFFIALALLAGAALARRTRFAGRRAGAAIRAGDLQRRSSRPASGAGERVMRVDAGPLARRILMAVPSTPFAADAGIPVRIDARAGGGRTPPRVFDRERVMDLMGGDEELLLDLVVRYRASATAQLGELREGLAGGDLRLVARVAHSLRGSSSQLCAPETTEAALALEIAARRAADEGRAFHAGAELSRLERAVAALLAALPGPGVEVAIG